MSLKILNPTYQRIPNRYEIGDLKKHFETCNRNLFIIEEKVDGKTIDGVEACTRIQDYEICLFGEFLEETHLIRYTNLPDKKICFDVNIEGKYLPPKQKTIVFALLGVVPVPIISTFEGYDNFSERYIRDLYLKRNSYFKTELNPEICRKFKHLCENFKQKYGKEKFSEGVITKCYKNGNLIAVKYVKPEFDETIKIAGRYEKYPEKNIVIYNPVFAEKILENNLSLLKFSENEKRLLLKLFERSYLYSYGKLKIEEIIKYNPNLPYIEKIIKKVEKEKIRTLQI